MDRPLTSVLPGREGDDACHPRALVCSRSRLTGARSTGDNGKGPRAAIPAVSSHGSAITQEDSR